MGGKVKQKNISDDELLDQCIRDNRECGADACHNSIRVIAMQCTFCRHVFCPTHQLPESHGCGQDARKHAQTSHPKPVNENRAADLHGKMNKKLEQMKKDRKKKGASGGKND